MHGLIYGVFFLVLGIVGFLHWWRDFLLIIKGLLPLVFIAAGLFALSTAISMVREQHAPAQPERNEQDTPPEEQRGEDEGPLAGRQ